MLDFAAKAHPNSHWWIKADGCDIIQGLCESVRGEWNGDVDLNDGMLKREFAAYKQRTLEISKLGLQNSTKNDLMKERNRIEEDIRFMIKGNTVIVV